MKKRQKPSCVVVEKENKSPNVQLPECYVQLVDIRHSQNVSPPVVVAQGVCGKFNLFKHDEIQIQGIIKKAYHSIFNYFLDVLDSNDGESHSAVVEKEKNAQCTASRTLPLSEISVNRSHSEKGASSVGTGHGIHGKFNLFKHNFFF